MHARRLIETHPNHEKQCCDTPPVDASDAQIHPDTYAVSGAEARRILGRLKLPQGLQWSRFICPDGLKVPHACRLAIRELITIDADGMLTISRREHSHTVFEAIEPEISELPAPRMPVVNRNERNTPPTFVKHAIEHMKCSMPPEI